METVLSILLQLIQIYTWALIIYIFMSWVPDIRASRFGQALGRICEPYLEPFRRIIPPIGMLDLSPLVAILVLNFARGGLISLFRMLGFI
ncbi:YggT family protein [Priestia megaterium]|nr:YggT family protein [Priestia megaterium]